MRKIDPELQERLATLIGSMGYELVGCERVPQGRHMTFRIYIDKEDGVNVDDCSKVSGQVSAMFDVEDPIPGDYTLEVSSPGMDRPLFELAHFQKFVGNRVKIRLYSPLNDRRQFKGIMLRVEGEDIHLRIDDTNQEVILPFSSIDKANVVADIKI